MLFKQSLEFITLRRFDVNLSRNISARSNQLTRRAEAMHASERRVGHEVTAFGSRLENAFAGVFNNLPVFALCGSERFFLSEKFLSLIAGNFSERSGSADFL